MTIESLRKNLIQIETKEEMIKSMLYESELNCAKDTDAYLSALRLILAINISDISSIYDRLETEGIERYEERDNPFR